MQKQPIAVFVEYIKSIFSAGLLAIICILFVLQAFHIPSGSMLQTLQIGDYILVNKFLYGIKNPITDNIIIGISDPQVGDIVVFRNPQDLSVDFIKRIVGIPGDRLEMRDRVLYRNGKPVKEPYIQVTQSSAKDRDNFTPITIPEGKYFMMGDNRDESYDSRFWGFVDRKLIKGKAWRVYWSVAEGDGFLPNVRWGRLWKKIE